jgi:transcriptional regulator with XRE-family HTH domain
MAQKARAAKSLTFSPEKAKAFFDDAKLDWQTHHRMNYVAKEHAEAMGIHEGSYGEILRGKRRASAIQCLLIARDLDLPVEDVVAIEGLPDIAGLIRFVENDKEQRYPGERESILATLRIAQQSPVWRQADWRTVIYRQQADAILASELDTYTKAALYADQVHEFSEHLRTNQMQSRAQRRTGEILISAAS